MEFHIDFFFSASSIEILIKVLNKLNYGLLCLIMPHTIGFIKNQNTPTHLSIKEGGGVDAIIIHIFATVILLRLFRGEIDKPNSLSEVSFHVASSEVRWLDHSRFASWRAGRKCVGVYKYIL